MKADARSVKSFPEVSAANSGAGIGCAAGILGAFIFTLTNMGHTAAGEYALWMVGVGAVAGLVVGASIGAGVDMRATGRKPSVERDA